MASIKTLGVKLLVDEIDKIVTAPYIIDINPLHTLIRNVNDNVIRQWCSAKSCQIPKLVSYLIKFLFEDRGIEIFERFCRVTAFGKAAWYTHPSIIPQLLAEAIRRGDKSNTSVLCSTLLSCQPLQRAGVPADLPRYLENLMRLIHRFPTTTLLHTMRDIIAQQSARVLELVSQDALVDFIKTCKALTKDDTPNNPSNFHEAAVISVNISSAVCDEVFFKAPGYPKDMANPKGSDVLCKWAIKLSRHFDGLKAPRVLHSLVARVMFFTSRNQHIPMPTRARTLDIIAETLDRFLFDVLEWSAENANAVAKVWRNCAGDSLDFDARLSAFVVACKISPAGAHDDSMEEVLRQIVTILVSEDEPCMVHLFDRASFKAHQITSALCYLLRQPQRNPGVDAILRSIVQFILAQCRAYESPHLDTCSKTQTAALLLQALADNMKGQQIVFAKLLAVLDRSEFPKWSPSLKDLDGGSNTVLDPNCCGSPTCARDVSRKRDQLRHGFSNCLLRGACTTGSMLSPQEFIFLQDEAFLCISENKRTKDEVCQYSANSDSFRSTPPALILPQIQGDWRGQLLEIMSNHQNESAEAVFGRINIFCKEFEERCQPVETPLHEAEAEVVQLNNEFNTVRTRLDLVETINMTRKQALQKADDAMRHKENEIAGLKRALDEANKTMNEKDHEISVLQCALDGANNLANEGDNNIITLQQEIRVLRERADKQQKEIVQQSHKMSTLKQGHQKKINDLVAEALDTKLELERLNKADRLSSEEQLEAKKQLAEKLAATIDWLELEKQKLVAEQQGDLQTHQEQMQQIKGEHSKAVEQLWKELANRDGEIVKLKEAIGKSEVELRQTTDQIHAFMQTEEKWLQEKGQLVPCLNKAEAKEKKVLAAIQGHDSNS